MMDTITVRRELTIKTTTKMIEVSNLSNYTPNQLSLLVDGIDLKIKQNNEFIRECNRWGEDFVNLHKDIIKSLERDLEDLYGLRVAIITVFQSVHKREKVILS